MGGVGVGLGILSPTSLSQNQPEINLRETWETLAQITMNLGHFGAFRAPRLSLALTGVTFLVRISQLSLVVFHWNGNSHFSGTRKISPHFNSHFSGLKKKSPHFDSHFSGLWKNTAHFHSHFSGFLKKVSSFLFPLQWIVKKLFLISIPTSVDFEKTLLISILTSVDCKKIFLISIPTSVDCKKKHSSFLLSLQWNRKYWSMSWRTKVEQILT